MREQILARLAARIAPEDRVAAVDELRRAPELQGDLSWVEAVLRAAEDLPLHRVGKELSDSLVDIFKPEITPSHRVEAALPIHDSRTVGQLVGVRGSHAGEGWTTVLTAASTDVIVDGLPQKDGLTELTGQMLVRGPSVHSFRVQMNGPKNCEVETDELGQFNLGSVPPGRYEFVASSAELEVTWATEVTAS